MSAPTFDELTAMRVLSVHPEHVEAFRLGLRTIETRTWSTPYLGPLALYATKRNPLSKESFDDPVASRVMFELLGEGSEGGMNRVDLPTGVITVVVDVVACLPIIEDPLDLPDEGPFIFADPDWVQIHDDADDGVPRYLEHETRYGHFDQGNFGLVFANRRPLDHPVPLARGPQGRPVELTGRALVEVLAQVVR